MNMKHFTASLHLTLDNCGVKLEEGVWIVPRDTDDLTNKNYFIQFASLPALTLWLLMCSRNASDMRLILNFMPDT